jgi:hypothetical protein
MGVNDLMPSGGRHHYIDPKKAAEIARRLKEGGRKADEIHKQREEHHKKQELPNAEAALEEELKKI